MDTAVPANIPRAVGSSGFRSHLCRPIVVIQWAFSGLAGAAEGGREE